MPRKKIEVKIEKEKVKLAADVYNTEGKIVKKILLPKEIFGAKINPILLTQTVRVYLANQRQGTHSTKTRGVVSGSTRKIYRQKGTGRARHGDIKAPIFIGGGIAHGPKPRDYSLELPRKMRRAALFTVLSDKWHQGRIKVIAGLEKMPHKTKKMALILEKLDLVKAKSKTEKTLLILSEKINNIILAGRNLSCLSISLAPLLNAYEILTHKNILFMEAAIPKMQATFLDKVKTKVQEVKEKKLEKKIKSKPVLKEKAAPKKTARKKA